MHDVTVLRIAAENFWNYLAECLREDSLVDVLDGVVYVLLRGRNATLHISLIAHKILGDYLNNLQR
jgi:hypothetical protein